MKKDKQFFFKKKNQKTFFNLRVGRDVANALSYRSFFASFYSQEKVTFSGFSYA
jgi:hypothetical protein